MKMKTCETCDGKGYVLLWPGEVDECEEDCDDCAGNGELPE